MECKRIKTWWIVVGALAAVLGAGGVWWRICWQEDQRLQRNWVTVEAGKVKLGMTMAEVERLLGKAESQSEMNWERMEMENELKGGWSGITKEEAEKLVSQAGSQPGRPAIFSEWTYILVKGKGRMYLETRFPYCGYDHSSWQEYRVCFAPDGKVVGWFE